MKRVLLTGSSHAAAIYSGWQMIQTEYDDCELEVLAFPVYAVKHAERKADGSYGLFVTDALKDQVRDELISAYGSLTRNLNDFSYVIVAGQQLGQLQALSLLASCGIHGLRPTPSERSPLLSLPAWRAFCRNSVKKAQPPSMFSELAGPKTIVLGIPLRSEAIADSTDINYREIALGLKNNPEGVRDAMGIFFDTARAVYAESGIELVTQPMETLCDFGFTKSEYNRASVNIRSTLVKGEAHMPADDYAHMNAQYGALVLRQVLDSLDAA